MKLLFAFFQETFDEILDLPYIPFEKSFLNISSIRYQSFIVLIKKALMSCFSSQNTQLSFEITQIL